MLMLLYYCHMDLRWFMWFSEYVINCAYLFSFKSTYAVWSSLIPIIICIFFCFFPSFCAVPWAPGGSKFTRNPIPPSGVSHYDSSLFGLSNLFSFLFSLVYFFISMDIHGYGIIYSQLLFHVNGRIRNIWKWIGNLKLGHSSKKKFNLVITFFPPWKISILSFNYVDCVTVGL